MIITLEKCPGGLVPKTGYQALDQTLTMFGYLKLCCSKPPSPPLSPTSQNLLQSGRQYLTWQMLKMRKLWELGQDWVIMQEPEIY